LSHGFIYSTVDPFMLIYGSSSLSLIVLLHVDDIILTGSTTAILHSCIAILSQQLTIKDLGDLHYFLSIQVVRSSSGILHTQQKYVLDLLHKFQLQTIKPVWTLLLEPTYPFMMVTYFRSLLVLEYGRWYLTMTRPDITYSVHAASQFMNAPCTTYMLAVKRILRYLQDIVDNGLLFLPSANTFNYCCIL